MRRKWNYLILKKQCVTYRAILKTHFIEENFEDFEVFYRVFLQLVCANLALSADSWRSSEDIIDRKLDGKIYFFAKCSSLRNQELLEKSLIFTLVFLVYLSWFCDSLEKLNTFKLVEWRLWFKQK